jgi:RND family efflux transporter MFP subunit
VRDERAEKRPCELALAGEGNYAFKGRVDFISPKLNADTGTLLVRTIFENADEALLPGLFARLRFPISTRKALLVPDSALLSDQQGRFALVVNDKDEVELRRVKIGTLEDGMRVVEEGLGSKDRVITLGVLKARPGSKVAPKVQEAAADRR